MKGAAMDLWEPIGAWATSRPGLAFQPVCGCFGGGGGGGGTAEIEDFKQMAVAVGEYIHGGGAAEEAADDRTQTVAFRRLTLMLFRHRS
ncbi:unnamed protein product [Brassica oleracea var. botrytis]